MTRNISVRVIPCMRRRNSRINTRAPNVRVYMVYMVDVHWRKQDTNHHALAPHQIAGACALWYKRKSGIDPPIMRRS